MILINGKSANMLTEDDLFTLIDNEEYKENQYIEYKKMFAFWDNSLTKEQKKYEAIEFKRDVCSFANAEGGYIIIGISDKNGLADELVGIEIKDDNKDKCELDIREKLNNIQPKTPSVKVHFINLKNTKYIVILEIVSDVFSPYVYNSGNDVYDFVSRIGNGKRRMSYNQVMRMFNQSLVIKKEIETFRQNRTKFYSKLKENKQYCSIHVISQDFVDVSAHKKVYMLYIGDRSLVNLPSGFDFVSPNVDGIKFIPYDREHNNDAYIFNSGICEFNIDLSYNNYLHNRENTYTLSSRALWNEIIIEQIKYSINQLIKLGFNKKVYIGFDLVCNEGTITEHNDFFKAKIDRNLITSSLIEVDDISNNDLLNESIRNLYFEYLLALGIKDSNKYNEAKTKKFIL